MSTDDLRRLIGAVEAQQQATQYQSHQSHLASQAWSAKLGRGSMRVIFNGLAPTTVVELL